MKVLHVIPSVGPVRGGTSQAVLELVKALRDSGVEAEIATTNDNGPDLLDVPLEKRIEYKQSPVWFFPRFSPPIAPVWEFAFSSQLTRWLWQHLAEYDLMHVHALFSYAPTVAMAIARHKKVPYIVSPHGLLCYWSLQQSAWKKRLYLAAIERANLDRARALAFSVLSEQQEAACLNLKAASYLSPFGLYVPTPIPDARHRLRQHLKLPADEPIVLFMSRLHYKKGLDYLIPALGQITNRRFTFLLAGSGSPEYEAEIEAMLLEAGMSDRTCRVGFVQSEQKELLLQGADLFALTSYSESFGLAVLEAIAAGLSVITTPGVPLAPVVKEYELGYVTPLEVEAIALALQHTLDDLSNERQTQHRRDRARQLILEKYTWDSIASNLNKVYQAILNQEPIPVLY